MMAGESIRYFITITIYWELSFGVAKWSWSLVCLLVRTYYFITLKLLLRDWGVCVCVCERRDG